MATKERRLQIVDLHKAQLAKLNQMIGSKATQAEFDKELSLLNELEAEYFGIMEKFVYHDNPDVVDLLRLHDFPTISHKTDRDKGVIVSFEYDERDVPVNLKRYCDELGYDVSWYYEMQALNKRLTMKVAETVGFTPEEVAAIDGSYAMHKNAREIALGETPTSNTQMVKHLQRVFDLLSPNTGKVNNHDIGFILSCYSKKSREALKVACSRHNALMAILLDVFHRVVTNGKYDVVYKEVKQRHAVSEQPKAEEKPAPKAKKAKSKKADKPAEDKAVTPAA
jgi:hypothetical protein